MSEFKNWNPMEEEYRGSDLNKLLSNSRSSNEESAKSLSLHVANVPLDMPLEALKHLLFKYGNVLDVDKRKPNEKYARLNKTYALVAVESSRDANRIIEGLHRKPPNYLTIKMAHTPEERERLKQNRLENEKQLYNGNSESAYSKPFSSEGMHNFSEIPKHNSVNRENHRLLPSSSNNRDDLSPSKNSGFSKPPQSVSNFSLKDDAAAIIKDVNNISKNTVPIGLGDEFISFKVENSEVNGIDNHIRKESVNSAENSIISPRNRSSLDAHIDNDVNDLAGEFSRRLNVSGRLCIRCSLPGTMRCSVCKARYCSRNCQQDDWYSHMQICRPPPPLEECDDSSEPANSVCGGNNEFSSITNGSMDEKISSFLKNFPQKPSDQTNGISNYRRASSERGKMAEHSVDTPDFSKSAQEKPRSLLSSEDLNYNSNVSCRKPEEIKNELSRERNHTSPSPVKLNRGICSSSTTRESSVENTHLMSEEAQLTEANVEFEDDILARYKVGDDLNFVVTKKMENNLAKISIMVANDFTPILMQSTFNDFIADLGPTEILHVPNVKIGEIVAVKTEDKTWSRGFIMRKIDSEVIVYLIDLGTIEAITEIKRLPKTYHLSKIPGLSLQASLFTKSQENKCVLDRVDTILAGGIPLSFRIEGIKPRSAKVSLFDSNQIRLAEFILKVWHYQFDKSKEKRTSLTPSSLLQKSAPCEEIKRPSKCPTPIEKVPQRKIYYATNLPQIEIKLGQQLVIPVVNDKGHVFVNIMDREWGTVQAGIQLELLKFSTNLDDISPKNLLKGELVCCLYEEDWYRSEILDLKDGKIFVKFIDFGDSGFVPFTVVRSFNEELMKYAALAVDIIAVGFDSIDAVEVETLMKSIIDKTVKMEVTTLHPLHAILFDCDEEPLVKPKPLLDNALKVFGVNNFSKEPVQNLVKSHKESNNGKVAFYDECKVLQLPLHTENVLVMVMFFKDYKNLYVVPESGFDLLEKMDDISCEMEKHCSSLKSLYYIPKVGEVVMAKFSEDDLWYRGVCISEPTETCAEIFYPDYCNSETVPFNRMCQMIEKFFEVPFLGIHCILDKNGASEERVKLLQPMSSHRINIKHKDVDDMVYYVSLA